jgi:hypothetical protein
MNELAAFPSSIRPAVAKVTAELPTPTFEPAGRFTVLVEGEPVAIPERIYFPELPPDITSRWDRSNGMCTPVFTPATMMGTPDNGT